MRAMALNQELRFQNVEQFKEALQQQKKVLSVDGELKRRKTMRGISIAGICLLLVGAGIVCRQVYVHEKQALYDVEAQIAVWMPDVNAEKMDHEGVVLTMYDGRLNLTAQVMNEVKKYYGEKVFQSTIPRNVRLSEAPSHGKPAYYYDRASSGTKAYVDLAAELMKRNR